MEWKLPDKTKIYEALGAVADNRVIVDGNSAKVYSSSRNKFYNVTYDPNKKAIMSNDNSSYYKGELGYPSIAFLMMVNKLSYDEEIGSVLKDIHWKDINQKFKNDFKKALDYILSLKTEQEKLRLDNLVNKVYKEVEKSNFVYLGEKIFPPEGY